MLHSSCSISVAAWHATQLSFCSMILLLSGQLRALAAVDPEVACCESLCGYQPVCGMGCRARMMTGTFERHCKRLSLMYAERREFLRGCTSFSRCSCPSGFQPAKDGSCMRCDAVSSCNPPNLSSNPWIDRDTTALALGRGASLVLQALLVEEETAVSRINALSAVS